MIIDNTFVQVKFTSHHGVGAVLIDALTLGVQLVGVERIQPTRIAVVVLPTALVGVLGDEFGDSVNDLLRDRSGNGHGGHDGLKDDRHTHLECLLVDIVVLVLELGMCEGKRRV